MDLTHLLLGLAISSVPEVTGWAAKRLTSRGMPKWGRPLLYTAATIVLVLIYGFSGGKWLGLGELVDDAAAWLLAMGLFAAIFSDGVWSRPRFEEAYHHSSGRRTPT